MTKTELQTELEKLMDENSQLRQRQQILFILAAGLALAALL